MCRIFEVTDTVRSTAEIGRVQIYMIDSVRIDSAGRGLRLLTHGWERKGMRMLVHRGQRPPKSHDKNVTTTTAAPTGLQATAAQ